LFDETPVGLRRRRTMIETQERLEDFAKSFNGKYPFDVAPTLDIICAVVLYDYQQLRYADQAWLPQTPALKALAEAMRQRQSFADTMPRIA
jgi:glutathione S-transferase